MYTEDYNKIIIVGYVNSKIKLEKTKEGLDQGSFTIINHSKNKKQEFYVCTWEKLALVCAEDFYIGKKVLIEGRIRNFDKPKRENTFDICAIRIFDLDKDDFYTEEAFA